MKSYVLENGLTVYFYQDKRKHSVSVNLVVNYGGAHSAFTVNNERYHMNDGVAHMIEHFVLEQGEYGNLMRKFNRYHLNANGITYPDHTLFYFKGVNYIDEALELLIKGIHSVQFTEQKLAEVKPAIYEEIRMKKDDKGRRLYETSLDQLFTNRTYRSGLGTEEQVKSITKEELELCFRSFYQPSNEFIVVAGNFNERKMLEHIKKLYCELFFTTKKPELIQIKEEDKVNTKEGEIIFPTAEPIIELTFKIDLSKLTNEEKMRLDYYISYFEKMNFSSFSPLSKKLLESHIIKDRLVIRTMYLYDDLIVSIGAYTKHFEELEKQIIQTLKKPNFDHEIFDLELKDAKLELVLRSERLDSIVFPFIINIIHFDYPYLDTIDYLNNLNYQDFLTLMNKLNFNHYTKVILIDQN